MSGNRRRYGGTAPQRQADKGRFPSELRDAREGASFSMSGDVADDGRNRGEGGRYRRGTRQHAGESYRSRDTQRTWDASPGYADQGRDSSSGRPARYASHAASPGRSHTGLALGVAAVLVVALAALALAVVVGGVGKNGEGDASHEAESLQAVEATVEQDPLSASASAASASASDPASSSSSGVKPLKREYDPSAREMLAIPGSDAVTAIELNDGSVSASPAAFDTGAIQAAMADVRENGDCGFVFLDMSTGYGLAFNADAVMYIASSSKAVLAHYALMNGAFGEYAGSIEEAITYSDNDAYENFGYAYADGGYGDWLDAHDAGFDNYTYDLYPPMSARSLASFWVEIAHYVKGDSEGSAWFADMLSSTGTSFIRDGIGDANATVMNKAGWIGEEGYESVTDAGIIEAGGHAYLMAIVTGQFDSEEAEENVAALAGALYNARDEL